MNADAGQRVGHFLRPLYPAIADGLQAGHQSRMFRVNPQPDNMHGVLAIPGDGHFHAIEKIHAMGGSGGTGFGQTAGAVVVGQRHQGGFTLGGAGNHPAGGKAPSEACE
jgi:hypothetical protein